MSEHTSPPPPPYGHQPGPGDQRSDDDAAARAAAEQAGLDRADLEHELAELRAELDAERAKAPAGEEPPIDEEQALQARRDAADQLAVGQVVTHTYFDPYSGAGGTDITVAGVVTDVDDDGCAHVAFLPAVSVIPADQLAACDDS